MIEIKIPWKAVSWLAPKQNRGRVYDTRAAEKRAARLCIKSQYDAWPLSGYIIIQFTFLFKPPVSASKKRKAKMLAGEIIPTHVDCTNCQKLYEDCLKKIVIYDDRNVAEISSKKLYADKEMIIIKIWTLEEHNNANNL